MWVWKNNWKLISRGAGCNKQGEEKHTIFCLRRSTYSQLVSSSYDQQTGSWRKEQTTKLIRCSDNNNSAISLEVNLLLFSCYMDASSVLIDITKTFFISLETPIFWLGSFLIFGQKLISRGSGEGFAIKMFCCAFSKLLILYSQYWWNSFYHFL